MFLQLEKYQVELEEMKNMTRQEYVAHLRRLDFFFICYSEWLVPNKRLFHDNFDMFAGKAVVFRGELLCTEE